MMMKTDLKQFSNNERTNMKEADDTISEDGRHEEDQKIDRALVKIHDTGAEVFFTHVALFLKGFLKAKRNAHRQTASE
jgi:hypothetical protein